MDTCRFLSSPSRSMTSWPRRSPRRSANTKSSRNANAMAMSKGTSSDIPAASDTRARASVTSPAASNVFLSGRIPVFGKFRIPNQAMSSETGTKTAYTHRHPTRSNIPAAMGPIMKATPNTEPSTPNALPRRSGGKLSPTNAPATGKRPDTASP
ncbi:MAG: hypothetical protein COV99_05965 [Bacteroidetes bacterium CG12_big_fil_rev_8_21_14_0_65_60_17]|nr:MAG: hypothetical protein COV99_05965 [Bacteroidetes bacterium CG12_big_fil_rev_8_21_14_0_65_60_17]